MSREKEFESRELQRFLKPPAKFEIGKTVATPKALEAIDGMEIMNAMDRHIRGDWGECNKEDQQANDRALEEGARILSVYSNAKGKEFWIITEANRALTTVILPEDY